MPAGEFQDRRVLITGGSRGLGRAIALAFAREGAWVGVNYGSDEPSALETAEKVEELGGKAICLQADVASSREVDNMVGRFLGLWGHLDVLVNNAGIIRDKMLMFLKEEDWDRVMDVNLKGTYLCSKAVLKEMVGRRYGRIINMASPSAITGRAGQTNYSASKGGICSFTRSLSREVARLGITVNAICPGVINTSMTDGLKVETRKELLNMIPAGKFGEPADVADAVLFLASGRAGYISGQILAVDGGMT